MRIIMAKQLNYKFNEGALIKEFQSYIDSTYGQHYGQGGLLDIAIEEDNNKKIIYLCFSKITKNSESATAINSYEFQNDELFNKKQIFVSNKSSRSSRHFGCRLATNSKYIFATIGDRGTRNDSQNLKNHSGSVIKILKNGNYYNNKAFKNSLPEIFSIGHRNPQGLTFNIDKTNLWLHEHGPQGGDELNLIVKGCCLSSFHHQYDESPENNERRDPNCHSDHCAGKRFVWFI